MRENTIRINRSLVYGWLLIVSILLVAYTIEIMRGQRDPVYLSFFIVISTLPAIFVSLRYLAKKDRYSLRYEFIVGYFLMYTFVMLTSRTVLVFTYILPMLSLLVLFHQPVTILISGLSALCLNIISIGLRYNRGELNADNLKDVEIQLAVTFLCFSGSYLAARIYDTIQKQNLEYTEELTARAEEMKQMTMQTIMTIANTIDAKDEYTRGHSRRVAEYAAAIARQMHLPPEQVEDIHSIGLLHDIGKIGIPDAVLNKPGKLTIEEYQLMKSHTVVGAKILKDIAIIKGLEIGAKYHHERYDGQGYPDGLVGKEIPLLARIIAVADAYDAMSSNRVYRRHLNAERIRKELVDGRGSQWDAKCVDAMLVLLDHNKLPHVNVESDTDMVQQATTILTRVIDLAVSSPSSRIGRDELTGLLSRDEGIESIQSAIYKNGSGIVMLFDIDHFHRINETCGFMMGDVCLRLMADVVDGLLPEGTAARVGADKFLLYVPDPDNSLSADELAKLFYERLEQTEVQRGMEERLSVSVGVAWVGTDKDRLTIVMDNAEKAVYVASQRGGNTWYCHRDDPYEDDLGGTTPVDLNYLIGNIKNHVFKKKDPAPAGDPELGKMYEFVSTAADRYKSSVLVLLFTVQSAYGVKGDIDGRDKVMGHLEKVIRENTRPGDFMTKFSSSQYAVLMMNLSMKDTESVTNRIIGDFLKAYGKREYVVHYDAAELNRPSDG